MSEQNAEYALVDPIFGTSIADTTERIMGDALRANTAETWHDAAQQLWGIDRLVTTIRQPGAVWGTHTTIALGNQIVECGLMADSPERRQRWAEIRAQIDSSGASE